MTEDKDWGWWKGWPVDCPAAVLTWYPKVLMSPATLPARKAPYGCNMRSAQAPTITPPAKVAFCTSTAWNFRPDPNTALAITTVSCKAVGD